MDGSATGRMSSSARHVRGRGCGMETRLRVIGWRSGVETSLRMIDRRGSVKLRNTRVRHRLRVVDRCGRMELRSARMRDCLRMIDRGCRRMDDGRVISGRRCHLMMERRTGMSRRDRCSTLTRKPRVR